MINQELIDKVQESLDWGREVDTDTVAELITSYTQLIEQNAELHKALAGKNYRIALFDKAISQIGAHIQKSEPSFTMCGVDTGDTQEKIIGYIKSLESKHNLKHDKDLHKNILVNLTRSVEFKELALLHPALEYRLKQCIDDANGL